MKFKARLKLKQPLYEPTGFDAAARAAGADPAAFGEIEKAAQGLTVSGRAALDAAIKAATAKPMILAESAANGGSADWYGSFKVKKVVDKWVASEFKTDIEPKFHGRPRSDFPEGAIEASKAAPWFSDIKAQQVALMTKIDTALQLEKKDAEASRALEQKEAELAQARATAQREQAAKETLIAQQQRQARQMPVRVQFRKALIGGTLVLRVEAGQAMTIRMDVVRGLQTFARDLQATPGRVVELGHAEGWGFRSGDSIRLSNPQFDPVAFAAP